MEKRNKGVSPVIATVLLIAIVIVLALIIFLWARGFVKEAITKKGLPSDQACEEIKLEINYNGNELQIINKGNIPIYRFELKGKSDGRVDKIELSEDEEKKGLAVGRSISFSVGDYNEVEVVPVILGETEKSKKAYTCKNSFSASLQ